MEDNRKKFEGFFVRNRAENATLLVEYFKIKNPDWKMTREDLDLFVDLQKTVEPMKNAKIITEERLQEEYASLKVEE